MFRNELRRTTSSVSIDSTSSESSNASNASNTSNKSEIYYTNNFSKNIPQYQLHDLRNEFKWDLETGTIVQNNYTLTPNSHISNFNSHNSNFHNSHNPNSSQNSPHSSQSSLAPPMPMPLLHPTIIKAPPKKRLTLCGRFKCIFSVILSNTIFVCANIKIKLRDNMLLGTEHTIKILPDCDSPARRSSKVYSAITDDEKKAIVLNDPKFGMFSLFKYQVTRGYKNHVLKHKNTMYCSHVFSTLAFLPILIFVSQWSIFISLAAHEIMRFDGNFCPNKSTWEKKLLMFAVAAVYFTKSFFLWDNLTDRTRLKKMLPATDIWVMLDTIQEFGFNLLIYGANLFIVYVEDDLQNIILNSLAMEFIMNLDNEFEDFYFDYLPETAVDIYDNLFVSYDTNLKKIEKRQKRCCFKLTRCVMFIPFKLLVLSLMMFPLFCFFSMFAGPICK